MSKRLNIAFYYLCILLLTGCEQDTLYVSSPTQTGEDRTEILLNASLVQAEITPTRNTEFLPDDNLNGMKVGIYVSKETGNLTVSHRHISNRLFTISESGALTGTPEWGYVSPNGNLFMPAETSHIRLFAYIPYGTTLNDDSDKPILYVKSGLCTDAPEDWKNAPVDPAWTAADVRTTPRATLQFAHAMARLNILIETTDEYKTYQLKDISVKLDRVQYGRMLLHSGTILSENTSQAATYQETYASQTTLAAANNREQPLFAHTLLPYSNIQKLTLTLLNPEGEEVKVTAFDHQGVNADLAENNRMTMNRGKAKTIIIRYKSGSSQAQPALHTRSTAPDAVIIDCIP